MRTMGPFVPVEDGPDYSLSWAVEGRGRRGVTCDLRQSEGKELFKRLVAGADVLCENFRPGTMERWGLGPDDLPEDLVYVRVSVFGQSGPYAPRPGLDRLGIAFGGLLHITGDPDRPPVRPGVTISDYLTGTFAAVAAVAALYGRDASGGRAGATVPSGSGEVIDAPLYGSILRILEWTLAGYDRLGIVREREGNRCRPVGTTRQLPHRRRHVRVHRRRLGRELRPHLRRHGPVRAHGRPALRHAGASRRQRRRDQRDRGGVGGRPHGRRGHGALRGARRAGRDRLQRGRHLRRSPHGRTGRPGARGRPGHRRHPPAGTLPAARRRTLVRRPSALPAWASTTKRSGATWSA